jgi:hypothetical protein
MIYDKRLGIGAICFACAAAVVLGGAAMSACGTSSKATPCEDYFDTVMAGGCCQPGYGLSDLGSFCGPPLPASEMARLRPRFRQLCESYLALPGIGVGASDLEACVSAVRSSGCSSSGPGPEACAFKQTGSLALGSSCASYLQCQNGNCLWPDASSIYPCGTCAVYQPPGIGQPCTFDCGGDAACVTDLDGGWDATSTCEALTYGDAGASCGAANATCAAGLVCTSSYVCEPPGGAGSPCQASNDCQTALGCAGSTCQMPGAAGALCTDDFACQKGLGCNGGTCGTVTWASPGQQCNSVVRCLFGGYCPVQGNTGWGTCPKPTADGQPCFDWGECDTFALCTDQHVCTMSFGSVCP